MKIWKGKVNEMKNINWARKLTSRKFWMAAANFVTMLIVALGGTENQAAQVAALIMAGASVTAYVIGEGLADAGNSIPEGELAEAGQEIDGE